jgi:hypothetical protein
VHKFKDINKKTNIRGNNMTNATDPLMRPSPEQMLTVRVPIENSNKAFGNLQNPESPVSSKQVSIFEAWKGRNQTACTVFKVIGIALIVLGVLAIVAALALYFTCGFDQFGSWVKDIALPAVEHFFTHITVGQGIGVGALLLVLGIGGGLACKYGCCNKDEKEERLKGRPQGGRKKIVDPPLLSSPQQAQINTNTATIVSSTVTVTDGTHPATHSGKQGGNLNPVDYGDADVEIIYHGDGSLENGDPNSVDQTDDDSDVRIYDSDSGSEEALSEDLTTAQGELRKTPNQRRHSAPSVSHRGRTVTVTNSEGEDEPVNRSDSDSESSS